MWNLKKYWRKSWNFEQMLEKTLILNKFFEQIFGKGTQEFSLTEHALDY